MPGPKYTPKQLMGRLRRYIGGWEKAVMVGFKNGLKFSLRYAITKRMKGGGRSAPTNRNKMTIRSGEYRRSVAIVTPRRRNSGSFDGGLKAGNGGVLYARLHEYGGVIRARRGPWLVFRTPDGKWHKKREVHIPARPVLTPALLATHQDIQREVRRSLGRLESRTVG